MSKPRFIRGNIPSAGQTGLGTRFHPVRMASAGQTGLDLGNLGPQKNLRGLRKTERSDPRGLGNTVPSAPFRGLSLQRLGVRKPGATKKPPLFAEVFLWSQQGMILRPPDYESGATNQLSYGTNFCVFQAICGVRTAHRVAVTTVRLLPSSELAFLASDLKSTKIIS